MNLNTFIAAYEAAIYFTDTGEEGQPPVTAELSPQAKATIDKDCALFAESAENAGLMAAYLIRHGLEQMGHDFWLSRNGHGTGFWDRNLGELGDKLHALAKSFGECPTYEGDDGLIHFGI